MKARTFLGFMFLLVLLTSILLAFTARTEHAAPQPPGSTQNCCDDDTRFQAADGGLIWESVSRHLLSAVQ